jgi:hypothetical protein
MGEAQVKEELYRWLGAIDVSGQNVKLSVVIRFINDILKSIEVEFMVNKQGYLFRQSAIVTEQDDPVEYIEVVINILRELLDKMRVEEENYLYYARF